MNTQVLKIEGILGPDIRTRSRINAIVRRFEPDAEYVLDFSNVKFISRSFADELVSLLEKSHKVLRIINENREVASLMEIVKSGRENKSGIKGWSEVLTLSNMKDVESFFKG